MSQLSNRLPELASQIKNANVVFGNAQKICIEAAYDMGECLVEAKALCKHGEWEGFLKKATVSVRSAQRYMRIVQSGILKENAYELGISGSLDEIDYFETLMPARDEAFLVVYGNEPNDEFQDFSLLMWWRDSRYRGGLFQALSADPSTGLSTTYLFEDISLITIGSFVLCVEEMSPPAVRRHAISKQFKDAKLEYAKSEAAKLQGAAA